jgi:hypothetical protein
MNAIPSRIRARSISFALMFLSLKITTPQMNEIITELRRTSETTDIIDSASLNDVKYAKSAMQMNMEISGMAQLQRKGVVRYLEGYHIKAQMMLIMII